MARSVLGIRHTKPKGHIQKKIKGSRGALCWTRGRRKKRNLDVTKKKQRDTIRIGESDENASIEGAGREKEKINSHNTEGKEI